MLLDALLYFCKTRMDTFEALFRNDFTLNINIVTNMFENFVNAIILPKLIC